MARLSAGVAVALLVASSARAADAPDVSAADLHYIGGRYAVHGTITVKGSGERRAIGGTVIFDQRGADFSATYHLQTRVRTEEGLVKADVVGRGSGVVSPQGIQGDVESQLITAAITGAYGTAPYMPRRIGPVLKQKARGSVDEHGVLKFELDYTPVPGGPLDASHVVLYGERVDVE
jgi:hypothetical protein